LNNQAERLISPFWQNMNYHFKLVRYSLLIITPLLVLALLTKCTNPISTGQDIEQTALNISNNLDSNSITLLHEYSYIRRGDNDFWQRIYADSILYSCKYRANKDTNELTVFNPLNFIKDFSSPFSFDTSNYFKFKFSEKLKKIVRITVTDNHGQDHSIDTSLLTKQIFPNQNPFTKFAELTSLKDRFGFIGTSYRSDIGEFIEFWITPQYKLTYMPDTMNLNPKSKKYWLDDFVKGKKIKEHWSLLKVYE
jgi:hypothetical protein